LPRNYSLVGICGRIESGKSTTANILKDLIPNSGIIPLAGELKRLARLVGWDGKKDDRGRRLLQVLGNDVIRDCVDEDYFIKAHRKYCIEAGVNTIIVDDVRYPNEYDYIKSQGVLLKVDNGKPNIFQHASEQYWPSFKQDFLIKNTGTVEELQKRLKEIVDGSFL